MRIRAYVGAFALGFVVSATPSLAGPPVEDALRLCRSDPVFGDALRMSIEDALRKDQGAEPDEADVDAMVELAKDREVTRCLTRLSEDPSIFRAFEGLSGFAVDAGWAAWRSQCEKIAGPKGPCIEGEGRAGNELRSLNADAMAKRVSGICQSLISDRKTARTSETENRTWVACLKAGLKAKPTAHALDECRFVSASADVPVADAMARCFREKAK